MATSAELLSSREPPPPSDTGRLASILKKFLGKDNTLTSTFTHDQESRASLDCSAGSGLIRRVSRKVVTGLPRAKTFKRQLSEAREKLEAVESTPAERRAVSVDRRLRLQRSASRVNQALPRASAPDFLDDTQPSPSPPIDDSQTTSSAPQTPLDEKHFLSLQDINSINTASLDREHHDFLEPVPSYAEAVSSIDVDSTTTSQYDAMISEELERKWILNLSLFFRDGSKREKFFVTYREDEFVWRRVTISLDYRNAPDDSLEKGIQHIKLQREKSAKIYEAIRESLQDIQFYPTVTNLKLQTTDGRLHVHVVEDSQEVIEYPTVRKIEHLKCRLVRESDVVFDSHMSGFVYKVHVGGKTLVKKEIPGRDTVDEFLYELNALNSLGFSRDVIEFYGVVVDDEGEYVKGLLIHYAEKGQLIDLIYESEEEGGTYLPWSLREKWARQIVQGLSDVHEAGFVQGDLTLSNIVIDHQDNAKIIDINRRGCPMGWEPPEATPLIGTQRISMYIGVKSDLYQLGMVLWALATLEDEPETHRRPLHLDPEIQVPSWYRTIVEYCLHEDPRVRLQASVLLRLFPQHVYDDYDRHALPSISVDDGVSMREYTVDGYQSGGHPQIRTVQPRNTWSYAPFGNTHVTSTGFSEEPYYYPPSRGRSPTRSLPDHYDTYSPPYTERRDRWPSSTVDPYTGYMERGENTPRERLTPEEIIAQMDQDLNQLEVEQAQTADEEGHTKANTQVTEAGTVAAITGEDVKTTLPPASNDTAGIVPDGSAAAAVVSDGGQALENSPIHSKNKELEQTEGVPPDRPRGVDTGVDLDSIRVRNVVQPPTEGDRETESLNNNYTHDRRRDISTRSTVASSTAASLSRTSESPPLTISAELTGVGGGLYEHDECRKLSFSDEDLGIPTTAATANVTTQA